MSVLFLNSEDKINEQEKLLMQSLLKNSYTLLYACPKNSDLATMANSQNIPCMEIPKPLWAQFFTLRAYLKKTRTTTIHVFDKKALKLTRLLKMSMRQPLKIITSYHDPIDLGSPEAFDAPKAYAIQALLAKKTRALFVSSPELFNMLQTFNLEANSLGLLPYSVDLEDEFPKDVSNQNLTKVNPKKRFVFLVDTTLEQYSGIDILLDALVILKTILPARSPIIEVHICGAGSLFHELLDKAHELGIDSMLAFFGEHDSQIFYKSAHAIICPANNGEGDYRSIINGWRTPLPVISSDLSVHTKLILSGKSNQSALIFPRDSVETLAQCMFQIVQNPSLRDELVATAETMLPNSQHDYIGSKYLTLIREL